MWLTRKGKIIGDVLEACRCNLEYLGWREKDNLEVARTFKSILGDALDGLSHIGGQCALGVQVCCVVRGWVRGPYSSDLGGGYHEIPQLPFARVSGGL